MNLDNIFIGNTEPKQTNVLWIDTSGINNSLKLYHNGQWTDVSGVMQETNTNIVDFNNSQTTQVWHLKKGWNRCSTYLDINLQQLENALSNKCHTISTVHEMVTYEDGLGWDGDNMEINPSIMFMLEMNEDFDLELTGNLASVGLTTINLRPVLNWIGYPLNYKMDVNIALKTFNPVDGDEIYTIDVSGNKILSKYNSIRRGGSGGWSGQLAMLEPGVGYYYRTTVERDVTYANMSYNSVVKDIKVKDGIFDITKIIVDDEPVENSQNLITSGAVYNAIHQQ